MQDHEEMQIFNSWEAILCIFGCVIIGGMIAFFSIKIWKKEFGKNTILQIQKLKKILWKSEKTAVENDDETCCKTVSFITLWSSVNIVQDLSYEQNGSVMKSTTLCELIKYSINF